MPVVIAGGHGAIALQLATLLEQSGTQAHGLIRNPGHSDDLRAAGAVPVVHDLEHGSADDLDAVLRDTDAVVFAAGAGPGSTAERKYSVDRDGAVRLAAAAQRCGVRRVVQISTMGVDRPVDAERGPIWAAYLDAKTQAEHDLQDRDLDWTIVRPGRLTDATATGRVDLGTPPLPYGTIPRADVAAAVAAILPAHNTFHRILELVGGDTPLADAIDSIR